MSGTCKAVAEQSMQAQGYGMLGAGGYCALTGGVPC